MKSCENCGNDHTGTYGSGRFCSLKCSRSFSTKTKRKEINEKVSKKLSARSLSDEHRESLSRYWKEYWKEDHLDHRHKLIESNKKSGGTAKYAGKFHPTKSCKKCGEKGEVAWFGTICKCCKEKELRTYRWLASFKFNVYDYPEKFDLTLIEKHGWYSAPNRGGNINGVSRDHLYSVYDGFVNGVDPLIIAHPANCKLILHTENQSKKRNSSITLEELLQRIEKF